MRGVLAAVALCLATTMAHAQPKPVTYFTLTANPAFLTCLAANPSAPPQAVVAVRRGELNDVALVHVSGLKPNLNFDLFTVQRSSLDAEGKPVPNFPGFGLAWYQTDLNADAQGTAQAVIETILLD